MKLENIRRTAMSEEDSSSKAGATNEESTAVNSSNVEKDLAGNGSSSASNSNQAINTPSNVPVSSKTNVLSVIGLIFAFFVPLIGLICSIIGLAQVKKKGEKGKGLAIAGIIISVIVGLLQILTIVLIVVAVNSNNITLKTYRDSSVGYSVKYPDDWTITPQNVEGAKGIVIKKSTDETGKVVGQIDVGYWAAPATGWNKDILQAIADELKKGNKNTTVLYEDRGSKNGLETITLITTYNGERGKVKAKTSIILKKDKSVYMVSTQTPEQNWDKYQDSFDEIHNTFVPNP
ncbi:DUF4190 domain-containing protein [Candidatus Saccharibacteria bacterium]|nr:DUF4190 domain-containing protein [Candidatus Saccharibacteria bacterium]